jgi:hypothetical protein
MSGAKKGAGAVTNATVKQDLSRELKQLRTLVREVGENFILRREGEIETLISNLAAVPPRKLRAVAPGLLHEIHSLRLKPPKGRLKDLKEMDRLIEDLTDRIISAQDEQARSG